MRGFLEDLHYSCIAYVAIVGIFNFLFSIIKSKFFAQFTVI